MRGAGYQEQVICKRENIGLPMQKGLGVQNRLRLNERPVVSRADLKRCAQGELPGASQLQNRIIDGLLNAYVVPRTYFSRKIRTALKSAAYCCARDILFVL